MRTAFESADRLPSPSRHLQSICAAACLALFAALVLSCAAPGLAQAKSVDPYGRISAQYESGSDPSCVVPGAAYGAWQMTAENAHSFAAWMKAKSDKTVKAYGTKLLAAYKKDANEKNSSKKDDAGACGKHFDKEWKSLASKYRSGFFRQQYLFVKQLSYTPAVNYLQGNVKGFKMSRYSTALRNVLFSTAVQHGSYGAYKIFKKAFSNLGGYSAKLSEKKIINAVYAVRSGYKKTSTLKAQVGGGQKVYSITKKDYQYYVKWGLMTKAQASKLKGKSLVNFYSCSGSVQVGVYYRLGISEPATARAMYAKYA